MEKNIDDIIIRMQGIKQKAAKDLEEEDLLALDVVIMFFNTIKDKIKI